jgi:putative glycosyltransferase
MKLSIVTTLYQSAAYIDEFHRRASAAARQLVGDQYEIILVNDGSPDDSLDIVVQLTENDSHVVVVDLSRNFGHHKAMMAGLEQAAGELVFLVDSDLEEEPEWLLNFFDQMAAEQCDVVYGVQDKRKGGWFERLSGSVYYTIFNWLADIEHPRNIVTARLMTRRYVDALIGYKEREIVISCLWVITGFKQSAQIVTKRTVSPTTYSFFRKIDHSVNSITSFSTKPLVLIFFIGVCIFFSSLVYTVNLVITRLLLSEVADGWTSVMVSIWMLGGMIISFVGVVGIYLSKVFSETKQRPYVIVRNVYGRSKQRNQLKI